MSVTKPNLLGITQRTLEMKMDVNEIVSDKQPSPEPQSEGDREFYRNCHWHLYFAMTFPDLATRCYHFSVEPLLRYLDFFN